MLYYWFTSCLNIDISGRRACPGESLARMEIFIFFVSILQRYNVCLPEGSTANDDAVEFAVRSPKPFDVIFTERC